MNSFVQVFNVNFRISIIGTLGPSAANTVSVPPPSALRGKTIEDIVNKWSTELEVHVREFNKFAGEVAVWDRALIENSNSVRVQA
jgi:nuclear pore complex protein Nup62